MPIQTHTSPAVTAHHVLTASQAAYDDAEDQAYWDAHEANLDSLVATPPNTLGGALQALRAIIDDAIDIDDAIESGLFPAACRAEGRVFQAAMNVAALVPSEAH